MNLVLQRPPLRTISVICKTGLTLNNISMIKHCVLALTVLAMLTLPASTAHAQANLTFSGGSGAPLTINLVNPVSYTMIGTTSTFPLFVFDDIGLFLPDTGFSGTATFSVNGGSAQTFNRVGSNYTFGEVTADDIVLYSFFTPPVAQDSVVVLSSFSITTTINIADAKPTDQAYATFITNNRGVRGSSNGIFAAVVPEGSTAALLGISLPIVAIVLVRRKR